MRATPSDDAGSTGSETAGSADDADPLAHVRDRFLLADGLVYLDGNSLGPLPVGVAEQVADVLTRQWGHSLIRGWNDHDWMQLPFRVGNRIGRLIGAPEGTVVVADSTSLNVAKVVAAGLRLRPGRRVVLSDSGNFPTDLYMAQGVLGIMGRDPQVDLRIVEPDQVAATLQGPDADDIAVVMLTHVDYRTGRMHPMAQITELAHRAGALMIWDLAHSAGAVEVDLQAADADLAVGCTYKYLNGGPGSPAFAYVADRHAAQIDPMLSGWMGHAAPFDFDLDYRPVEGVGRMQVGTPPVIALSALDAALDVWDGVTMTQVREKSVALTQRFIAGVEQRCAAHEELRLVSPRDPNGRGSQVSFSHPDSYAIVQTLIARDVIGDFRAPDIMRFGFAPLYLRHADVDAAVEHLGTVLDEELFDDPSYRQRAAVT